LNKAKQNKTFVDILCDLFTAYKPTQDNIHFCNKLKIYLTYEKVKNKLVTFLLVTQCGLYLNPPELIGFHLSVLTLVIVLSNKLSWLFSQ